MSLLFAYLCPLSKIELSNNNVWRWCWRPVSTFDSRNVQQLCMASLLASSVQFRGSNGQTGKYVVHVPWTLLKVEWPSMALVSYPLSRINGSRIRYGGCRPCPPFWGAFDYILLVLFLYLKIFYVFGICRFSFNATDRLYQWKLTATI